VANEFKNKTKVHASDAIQTRRKTASKYTIISVLMALPRPILDLFSKKSAAQKLFEQYGQEFEPHKQKSTKDHAAQLKREITSIKHKPTSPKETNIYEANLPYKPRK